MSGDQVSRLGLWELQGSFAAHFIRGLSSLSWLESWEVSAPLEARFYEHWGRSRGSVHGLSVSQSSCGLRCSPLCQGLCVCMQPRLSPHRLMPGGTEILWPMQGLLLFKDLMSNLRSVVWTKA